MRWRVDEVAVLAVTAAMTVAGCAHTVSGTAQRAQLGVPDPDRSYGYLHDRCGLLADETVQQTLGADSVVRPYSGAVCQYVLMRGDARIDVTFAWFETGSLDRERALADDRGAEVTDTVIDRHSAFLARRDVTGAACSATAAAGTGVLSWWVQLRNPSAGDPCGDAEKLLSATLQSEM
ncbi:DUF3558 domain-containing protein [Mycolicibacterium holsaticum]|uniref:DUF3558 domain-containing protein n=1 Tax=Mycolicibacterium holsaticum TaxID=152142 RepID=A0A1E3R596_9MYCO|nr:DUF3558 domain-containing protein [Mycolicibacterium holsaticum]ODQ84911.1 hypothetical protein BHQ17_25360 [Mycolicibacterium holsaticum]